MLEKKIETTLLMMIKKRGGLCLKFTSPGHDGVPDRLCILDGRVAFVELKAPDGKPRALQKARAGQLRSVGARVYCINSKEQAVHFADALATGYPKESDYCEI